MGAFPRLVTLDNGRNKLIAFSYHSQGQATVYFYNLRLQCETIKILEAEVFM